MHERKPAEDVEIYFKFSTFAIVNPGSGQFLHIKRTNHLAKALKKAENVTIYYISVLAGIIWVKVPLTSISHFKGQYPSCELMSSILRFKSSPIAPDDDNYFFC